MQAAAWTERGHTPVALGAAEPPGSTVQGLAVTTSSAPVWGQAGTMSLTDSRETEAYEETVASEGHKHHVCPEAG